MLVGCEYSGRVRDAFLARGHDAYSCDLLPTESNPDRHLQMSVREVIRAFDWDLAIFHPPCTHLAVSGAAWFKRKREEDAAAGVPNRQEVALGFVRELLECDTIPRIALENPVSIISSRIRRPTQVVHPWMFGHPEQKATCLWLKGLPPLKSTSDVRAQMLALPKRERERLHYLSPRPERWKERSRTFQGLADAMAEQWGDVVAPTSMIS